MKYKGNKSLMKCCKSCQNKKGIRCLGEPRTFKYQGYKFCTECTRTEKEIEKSFSSLKARISLNKRTKYTTSLSVSAGIDMTTQSDASSQIVILKPGIEELKKSTYTLGQIFKNAIKAIKKRIGHYGKSKEV
jgi:hypothetical protein